MMFKKGDGVVIRSNTSCNNGTVVTVECYTKGKRKDILQVSTRSGKMFFICESSIFKATIFDEIRNFNDGQLQKLLPWTKRYLKNENIA